MKFHSVGLFLFLLFTDQVNPNQDKQLNNFIIQDDLSVIYQKVFEPNHPITKEQLLKSLKFKGNLENFTEDNNTIYGEIIRSKVDYKKYGGKWGNTMTLLNGILDANFILEIKENRYRLTVKDIVFTDNSSLYASESNNTETNKTDLNRSIVNKRKKAFRKGKTIEKGLSYIDQHFSEIFTFKKKESSKW